MKRLSERRNILCINIRKKSLKVENFGHLFPSNSKSHDMNTRKSDYYKVSKSYSKRYLRKLPDSHQNYYKTSSRIWPINSTFFTFNLHQRRSPADMVSDRPAAASKSAEKSSTGRTTPERDGSDRYAWKQA